MRAMAWSLADWIKLITAAALWPARSEPAINQFVVATEVIVHQRSSLSVQEHFGVGPRPAFAKVVHHGFDVLVRPTTCWQGSRDSVYTEKWPTNGHKKAPGLLAQGLDFMWAFGSSTWARTRDLRINRKLGL